MLDKKRHYVMMHIIRCPPVAHLSNQSESCVALGCSQTVAGAWRADSEAELQARGRGGCSTWVAVAEIVHHDQVSLMVTHLGEVTCSSCGRSVPEVVDASAVAVP